MRRRSKKQKYKGALFEQLGERLGLSNTEQKTRQQNKTQGSKQDKQIINQNIRVLTPLVKIASKEPGNTSLTIFDAKRYHEYNFSFTWTQKYHVLFGNILTQKYRTYLSVCACADCSLGLFHSFGPLRPRSHGNAIVPSHLRSSFWNAKICICMYV